MKLSSKTLAVLSNFASINQSILIKPGNVLRTIHPQKTILAEATVDETFPVECAIYDLRALLGAINLLKDPEIDFQDKYIKITSGGNAIKFYYASPDLVVAPPSKKITLPSSDVELSITETQLGVLYKAMAALGVPELLVEGKSGNAVVIAVTDTRSETSNRYDVVADETADANFRVIFKTENLKLLPGDYDVAISKQRISLFKNATTAVTYYVAVEAASTFE
ncbi:MAG: hypothetical protein DDT26_00795 [Dehalococcoidia bacterium]|nr:hypothetical protein [Chloroflexota bacterium]